MDVLKMEVRTIPRRKEIDRSAVLQRYRGAAEILGVSEKFLREGVKAGSIPYIKVGKDTLINMPVYLEQLNAQSRQNLHGDVR